MDQVLLEQPQFLILSTKTRSDNDNDDDDLSGTIASPLQTLSSRQTQEIDIITPTLQMRKLSLTEVRQLAPNHTAKYVRAR